MQVTLTLKRWKVSVDEKTKLPKLSGAFALLMGDKEIANQDFNDGYNSKEIPFSSDLINKLVALEADVKLEMERLLS
jgi:hypothetical protein